mmetsp:Transcript_33506/g.76488  ORF Transcript_33506/g.76488 Transcript_33506/m.76488 type:complete len:273 (+) Transcript_33506:252-1070(+)
MHGVVLPRPAHPRVAPARLLHSSVRGGRGLRDGGLPRLPPGPPQPEVLQVVPAVLPGVRLPPQLHAACQRRREAGQQAEHRGDAPSLHHTPARVHMERDLRPAAARHVRLRLHDRPGPEPAGAPPPPPVHGRQIDLEEGHHVRDAVRQQEPVHTPRRRRGDLPVAQARTRRAERPDDQGEEVRSGQARAPDRRGDLPVLRLRGVGHARPADAGGGRGAGRPGGRRGGRAVPPIEDGEGDGEAVAQDQGRADPVLRPVRPADTAQPSPDDGHG